MCEIAIACDDQRANLVEVKVNCVIDVPIVLVIPQPNDENRQARLVIFAVGVRKHVQWELCVWIGAFIFS